VLDSYLGEIHDVGAGSCRFSDSLIKPERGAARKTSPPGTIRSPYIRETSPLPARAVNL